MNKDTIVIGIEILKKEGFLSLIKKSYIQFLFPYFQFYPTLRSIKKMKDKRFESIDSLIHYVFKGNSGYLRPMQVKSELYKLSSFIQEIAPNVMMEIGTANGGTLFTFSRILNDNAHIISLDLPKGIHGGGYPNWKIPLYESFKLKNQKIDLIRADSHLEESFNKVKRILNGSKLDFLFIDGDHTYEGVKQDFQMYSKFVKNGGYIAFHDVVKHPPETNCNVYDFWNEIKDKYETIDLVEDWGQGWAGICLIKLNK